jgi:hypothetical protein
MVLGPWASSPTRPVPACASWRAYSCPANTTVPVPGFGTPEQFHQVWIR